MKRSLRRYTKEFKQEAVNLALKSPSVANTLKAEGNSIVTAGLFSIAKEAAID